MSYKMLPKEDDEMNKLIKDIAFELALDIALVIMQRRIFLLGTII